MHGINSWIVIGFVTLVQYRMLNNVNFSKRPQVLPRNLRPVNFGFRYHFFLISDSTFSFNANSCFWYGLSERNKTIVNFLCHYNSVCTTETGYTNREWLYARRLCR